MQRVCQNFCSHNMAINPTTRFPAPASRAGRLDRHEQPRPWGCVPPCHPHGVGSSRGPGLVHWPCPLTSEGHATAPPPPPTRTQVAPPVWKACSPSGGVRPLLCPWGPEVTFLSLTRPEAPHPPNDCCAATRSRGPSSELVPRQLDRVPVRGQGQRKKPKSGSGPQRSQVRGEQLAVRRMHWHRGLHVPAPHSSRGGFPHSRTQVERPRQVTCL